MVSSFKISKIVPTTTAAVSKHKVISTPDQENQGIVSPWLVHQAEAESFDSFKVLSKPRKSHLKDNTLKHPHSKANRADHSKNFNKGHSDHREKQEIKTYHFVQIHPDLPTHRQSRINFPSYLW